MATMTTVASEKTPATTVRPPDPYRTHKRACAALAVVIVVVCVAIVTYIRMSPFSRNAVLRDLEEAGGSTVTIRSYRRTHFPAPGCVLEGVEFRQGARQFKLISIDKLVIKGSYFGLLRQHVMRIKAEGAHVFIPPIGSDYKFPTKHTNIVIDQIIANGATVDFVSDDPDNKTLLRFDVHEALLSDVRWEKPISYRLKFRNPQPPGEISVEGKFGAWTTGHPGDTPISGEYTFDHADLGVYGGISGFLSSQGRFGGVLKHIDVSGTTDTPDFEVESGNHKVRLTSRFDAYVDGIKGDTFLKRVDARFGRTTVVASGSIADSDNKIGKVAQLRLTTRRGRIEDFLGLFIDSPRSPMSGEVSLSTKAEIPGGDVSFLRRVRLDGSFGVDDGKFSDSGTQQNVDQLSAGARGQNKEDPETVLTNLEGKTALIGGVARFSDLSFSVPGAFARMHGNYDVVSHKVDLHGLIKVDKKISDTSTGMKAFLLKVMDPIFKKKKKGEIVPVHVTGTYEKPQFGLDLGGEDHQQAKGQK